jgi:hypothetical protein
MKGILVWAYALIHTLKVLIYKWYVAICEVKLPQSSYWNSELTTLLSDSPNFTYCPKNPKPAFKLSLKNLQASTQKNQFYNGKIDDPARQH